MESRKSVCGLGWVGVEKGERYSPFPPATAKLLLVPIESVMVLNCADVQSAVPKNRAVITW